MRWQPALNSFADTLADQLPTSDRDGIVPRTRVGVFEHQLEIVEPGDC